jgi:pimeloyl-ACP methyl ester carboxylesterase
MRKGILRMTKGVVPILFILVCSYLLWATSAEWPIAVAYEARVSERQPIHSLESITLGNLQQWILIRGHDVTAPVLLFLHGGPGVPSISFVRDFDATFKLQEHFVLVYWDQRGAGKSYNASIPPDSMTIEQFIADTRELVEVLRKRFATTKIYLVGHSWGSLIGALTTARYPELFSAYVGIGQVVHMRENEALSYQLTLEQAVAAEHAQALRQLTAIGPPPYDGYREMLIERQWVRTFDQRRQKQLTAPRAIDPARFSLAEVSFAEALAWLPGPSFSMKHLWDELYDANLFQQAPRIDVPVYLLEGRYDYYAPSSIARRYYEQLDAPKGKTFVWFDHSGHSPPAEEPEKFYNVLVHGVLKETCC